MTSTLAGAGTPYSLADWTVRPGNEEAFIETWSEFARWTAEHQPGAGDGTLLRDRDDPRRFVSFGPWRDPESMAAWRKTPEFQAFFARFHKLCTAIEPRSLVLVAGR
jgi:heme-degrading monooxygenase HmoA